MSHLQDKIASFYKKHEIFKKPLEKIINNMFNKCRYINGESLERHNWGKQPIKLKNIPKDISSHSFEAELLNALNLDDNEKSIVELLWGDIQLGKRAQACVIMWISVHILKRPVLYIFRNLSIDQQQLQEDIDGTENYNFNIQFIKNLFEEFNTELQEVLKETDVNYWEEFKLPKPQDINNDINNLSNKEAINSTPIRCCLMNPAQLAKINMKFSESISKNCELVPMTILVDESDLMSPTSTNDRSNDNDKKDSTACEILLAKIYKKVKYALHITGTAHSLLYNITTRLNDNTDIQIKISKVHKMNRSNDYYGLFNNSIIFNTTIVESWWDYQDADNHKKKTCYDIVEDYNINIKKIIANILIRPIIKYNSLLISEEKIRVNQFCLVNKIIQDFPNLFIIIYHGGCLRLYLSKDYENNINYWSQWDAKQSSTSQRLWQPGGIYGSSIDNEKSEKLPNNYCYFNINTNLLNIKLVYKLLRILFEKNETPIINKTVITITGKYGERGYSFTSDDYDNYSFHLTDQYFVSHASLNCTDISQRLRLQGKYNDNELKNKTMKLTLWTTPELQDIIQNFYVKFIKEIEKFIMSCANWEDIKDLLELIIDNGELKCKKYINKLDTRSKRAGNIIILKHFESKNNGYGLIQIDDMNDDEIAQWCTEKKLPTYICINEIKTDLTIEEFSDKYKTKCKYNIKTEFFSDLRTGICINFCKKNDISLPDDEWVENREKHKDGNIYKDKTRTEWKPLLKKDIIDMYNAIQDRKRRWYYCYEDASFTKLCYAVQYNDKIKENLYHSSPVKNKISYLFDSDKVKYSVLKEEYKQQNTHGYTNEDDEDIIEDDGGLPNQYYWKTPDSWLYLYDKDKPEIISLNVVAPLPIANVIYTNILTEPLINNDILLFSQVCCKKTEITNLRFGLKDIYKIYELWCKINNKKSLNTQKKFKEEFEKINYKEENSKGVDINNNPGKRGYNIMVSL